MDRGEEKQVKLKDVFTEDKKFYKLVEIAPLVDKLIELHKRFDKIYPELVEANAREKDEREEALKRINDVYEPWNVEWGEGSPAKEAVDAVVRTAVRLIEYDQQKHKIKEDGLDTVALFMNTALNLLDSISTANASKDARIEYLEEKVKELEILLTIKKSGVAVG